MTARAWALREPPVQTTSSLGVESAPVPVIEFVFVHSYSSEALNWQAVMIGDREREGRIATAKRWADAFSVPVVANDKHDTGNHDLFVREGIENICTALRTRDEAQAALDRSRSGAVLFVTSPDHLPRVVRDVLAAGGLRALFASSDIPFSEKGAAAVEIKEPPHGSEVPHHDAQRTR